jgi:glycosyltransferase involved in cell wall biosynthesis
MDYMMAKKPIIQYIEAGNDILQEAKAGISVKPENPQAIVDAINKLMNLPKEELNKIGQNGHDFVIKNHDYKILAQKFIDVMQN